jgi:divalent metal cation (Fe/Co/Zn/Cd) transporter
MRDGKIINLLEYQDGQQFFLFFIILLEKSQALFSDNDNKYNLFDDHGLRNSNQHKAREFLYHNNWVALIIFIVTIILAQTIFQVIYEGINYIINEDNNGDLLRALFITALFIGGLFWVLTYTVFKIPVAAAFTY